LTIGLFALTIYGSLIPFEYRALPLDEAASAFRDMAFYAPSLVEARGDWMVSVLLFLAIAYAAMGAASVDCPWEVGVGAAVLVVAGCVLLSVAIEFLQVYFPPRTVSINDILVESLGAGVGVVLWLCAGQRVTDWLRRLWAARTLPALARLLLPVYLVVLIVVELMPFDLVLGTSELRLKYEEDKIHLVPFHDLRHGAVFLVKAVSNMLCFLPLGLLGSLAAGPAAWTRQRWWRAGLLGLAAAGAIEFGQLWVYSRYFDTTDIVTGTAAVLAGAWVGRLYWEHGRALATTSGRPPAGFVDQALVGALVAWAVLLAAANWWPLDFTADPGRFPPPPDDQPVHGLRHMYVLPLVDYYWGSKYQALDQFVKRLAAFAPLGGLCALRLTLGPPRPHPYWMVWCIALLVPLAVEAGKYFLPSHTPSVTNALIGSAAVWTGFMLTRHLALFPELRLHAEAGFHG
jgi:VanZ family protein